MPIRPAKKTQEKAQDAAAASASASPQSEHATITSAVAADTSLSPNKAAKRLFPCPPAWKRGILRGKIKEQLEEGRGKHWNWHKGAVHEGNAEPSDEELQAIRERYGYKAESEGGPGRLFLMMLADALLPLPRNPMSGVCSPPLLATTGIVPFTIFSTGPDIIQHYVDCIIAAKKEVILLTNYWQMGKNVDRIAEALRELNKRQARRRLDGQKEKAAASEEANTGNGESNEADDEAAKKLPKATLDEQIVVKIMWDRGPQTLADLFRLRKQVYPSMWKENGLPQEHEVPNLSVEILNYHRPLMGTFHAKLLLVDRQVALINSNNIQDRPNIEACTRLEGDIVNSVYDHALISWGNRLNPPLPCLSYPATKDPPKSSFSTSEDSSTSLPRVTASRLREIAHAARMRLQEENVETEDLGEKSRESWMTMNALGQQRRLSFADVVENVIKGQHHHQGHPSSPAAAAIPASNSAPNMSPTMGKETEGESSEMSPADRDRATRNAGAEWARKVLGERRFAQLHALSTPSATPVGTPGEGASTSTAVNGSVGTDAHSNAAPSTTPATHSASAHHRRPSFADVVNSLMEKEGIKPALWAEGALDAFGLGPSSSRNVADDARRSKGQRKDAAARGINVPQSVNEESALTPAAAQANGIEIKETPADADGDKDEEDAKPFDRNLEDEEKKKNLSASHYSFPSSASTQVNGNAQTSREDGKLSVNGHGDDRSSSSRSSTDEQAQGDVTLGATNSNEDKGDETAAAAPGSQAYRAVHRRTLSNLSKASASERLAAITKSLDFANLSQVKGEITAEKLATMAQRTAGQAASLEASGEGSSGILDFNPYIFHAPHSPVPMALVNRRPHGTPGHSDIRNAQDAAWLAGFRYAKRHIFVQSPTLNATPIKHAVLHACRRHVRVELWLGLGFNDKSESMPFQGGTNESVVTRLYRQLRREGKGDEKYLEVFWYTGKDMTRPLNAVRKQRNCHVKYAQFDGEVAIIGSGNQDTQSWYHSQEINVMLDGKTIIDEWDKGLRRNQSTHLYGKVDKDGVWRGQTGAERVDKGGD